MSSLESAIASFDFHLVSQPHRALPEGYAMPRHRHSFHELGIVFSGQCQWHLDGKPPVTVSGGEAILVAAHQAHAERVLRECGLAWVGFQAPPEEVAPLQFNRLIRLPHHFDELRAIVERLAAEEMLHAAEFETRLRLLVADLLLILRRSCSKDGLKSPPENRKARLLESAAIYLERNCTEDLTMEQVARYHGLSHSHFGMRFKERFGLSPKEFQQRARLRLLETAVAAGVVEIKALAMHGKFDDVAYFCRWLKGMTGLRPTGWIRSQLR